MRKLVSFFRSVFVTTFRVWKYYTLKEFFDKGGYIYTLVNLARKSRVTTSTKTMIRSLLTTQK